MESARHLAGAEGQSRIELYDRQGARIAAYTIDDLIGRLGILAFPYVAGAKRLALLDGLGTEAEIDRLTAKMRTPFIRKPRHRRRSKQVFERRRILVVEDVLLLADTLNEILETLNFDVIGPASRLHTGLRLAQEPHLHGAILDINVAGELSFPIAAALKARAVPVLFITSYENRFPLPAALQAFRRVQKPLNFDRLAELATETFGESHRAH